MSVIFWFLLFISNYICLFSLKSILLGMFLLLCSFSVSLLMGMYLLTWYSLIFFLVYMGGLLVLFVYTSSLKFNPNFSIKNMSPYFTFLFKIKFLFLFLSVMLEVRWKGKTFSWSNTDEKKYSFKLLKESEIFFLMNVGLLLLLVLWIMSKLSFRNRGALRPSF